MIIYKYISTIKAKDPKDKQPTHYLVAKSEQTEKEGVFVASLWSKEYKNKEGSVVKFLSGEMKSEWTDHTDTSKNRKGYVIVEEAELNKLLNGSKLPPETLENAPQDDLNEF